MLFLYTVSRVVGFQNLVYMLVSGNTRKLFAQRNAVATVGA